MKNNHDGNNIYGKITTYALSLITAALIIVPTIYDSYSKSKPNQTQIQADFWKKMDLRENADKGLQLKIEDGCKEAEK